MSNSHEDLPLDFEQRAEYHWRKGAKVIHPDWTEDQIVEFIRKRKALLDCLTPKQLQALLEEKNKNGAQALADYKAGKITQKELKQQMLQLDTEPLAKRLFSIDADQL